MADFNFRINQLLDDIEGPKYDAHDCCFEKGDGKTCGKGSRYGICYVTWTDLGGAKKSNKEKFIQSDMTRADAKGHYERMWKKLKLSDLKSDKVAAIVFDACVNSGMGGGGGQFQHVLAAAFDAPITVDGVIGAKTIAAANLAIKNDGEDALYNDMYDQRAAFLSGKPLPFIAKGATKYIHFCGTKGCKDNDLVLTRLNRYFPRIANPVFPEGSAATVDENGVVEKSGTPMGKIAVFKEMASTSSGQYRILIWGSVAIAAFVGLVWAIRYFMRKPRLA